MMNHVESFTILTMSLYILLLQPSSAQAWAKLLAATSMHIDTDFCTNPYPTAVEGDNLYS